MLSLSKIAAVAGVASAALASFTASAGNAQLPKSDFRVVTYHYDNLRTGWNAKEKALTPQSVASSRFKMTASIPLDDQVDAQPLLMTNQRIEGQGVHDVLYVATESNTLYAIDAATGNILKARSFGPAVPYTALPGQCPNNGPNVGITSTPVINQATGAMYLMAYTYRKQRQNYELHEIDLSTLRDTTKPTVVTASGKLADGSTYNFDPTVSRQRPGLLLSGGNIYAGFGSFCDVSADISRGWLLGWSGDTLAPLSGNELTNTRAHSTDNFFLTAIWMSGYAPAAGLDGDLYFVTGNSDFSGDSFDPKENIAESVVQLSDDLLTVKSLFTPKGRDAGWRVLDQADEDFGSGGAMLLPPQSGASSNLLTALGKAGKLYLLNADDLSNGGEKGNAKALDVVDAGACWCGESYYQGDDGLGRVVSSGGNIVRVWTVKTSRKPKLVKQSESAALDNGQDPGLFTTVSSNGTKKGTAVVWALGRPTEFDIGSFKLYAIDPANGHTLFSGDAGVWTSAEANADLVPVVANGRVYVASFKTLSIFGLSDSPAASLPRVGRATDMRAKLADGEHEIYGAVRAIDRSKITVAKRDGRTLVIDASNANANGNMAQPAVGKALIARGAFTPSGVLKARMILHAKSNPKSWHPDR